MERVSPHTSLIPKVMPLTLFLEYVTPPRIILPRVLGVCFVEDIPVKQMVRDQFSEGEFNFVWLECFFYALHYHKCKKQRCWTVKFTSNKKVPIKELTSFSKIRKQKITMKINS